MPLSKIVLTFIGIFVLSDMAKANPGFASGEAQSLSETLKNYKPSTTDGVPGYVGSNVPEAHYKAETMESAKYEAAANSETFKMVQESLDKRAPYEIDVINDPLFKQSNDILSKQDWQAEDAEEEPAKASTHKCYRGRPIYEAKCKRILVPQKTGTRKEEKTYTVNVWGKTLSESGYANPLYATNRPKQNPRLQRRHPRYLSLEPSDPTVINAFKNFFSGTDAMSGEKIALPPVNNITSVRLVRSHGGQILYYSHKSKNSSSESWGPRYVEFVVITVVEIPVFELVWQEACSNLEALLDQGNCELVTTQCLGGPAVKIVEGVELKAECWEEELTYRCHGDKHNGCTSLLQKGCIQVNSVCKTKDGDDCIEWEQTFECYEGKKCLAKSRLKGDNKPFCLDGDCVDQSWAPNQDMADSLSKLSIFKEMQKNMDPKTQKIFKGNPATCSRIPASFKNCCAKKGWGLKVGLANCSNDEKQLAEQRKANKCIQVGTYCTKKKLGICEKKKTTFCCYPTKLARLINEQGAQQLGINLGTPREPRCDALTLADFTRIDFSKIDFSELFSDIIKQTKLPNTSKITASIQKSMSDNSRIITDKQKQITQGRSNDSF